MPRFRRSAKQARTGGHGRVSPALAGGALDSSEAVSTYFWGGMPSEKRMGRRNGAQVVAWGSLRASLVKRLAPPRTATDDAGHRLGGNLVGQLNTGGKQVGARPVWDVRHLPAAGSRSAPRPAPTTAAPVPLAPHRAPLQHPPQHHLVAQDELHRRRCEVRAARRGLEPACRARLRDRRRVPASGAAAHRCPHWSCRGRAPRCRGRRRGHPGARRPAATAEGLEAEAVTVARDDRIAEGRSTVSSLQRPKGFTAPLWTSIHPDG